MALFPVKGGAKAAIAVGGFCVSLIRGLGAARATWAPQRVALDGQRYRANLEQPNAHQSSEPQLALMLKCSKHDVPSW